MAEIPFNRAALAGRELEYIRQAVDAMHLSGDGSFTARCHAALTQLLGVPAVVLTTSCTHALEMCALLLNIGPGDEVVVPTFTFVSTANAFVLRGARPVFVDVRRDTCNLDEALLEQALTSRTRAIVGVHYAGVACEMDTICAVAARHGIPVVEDNAHGLFGKYKGRALGTIGDLATLSFHETKNLTCGEGGALVLNRREHVARAEIVREKGTDRRRFFRGEVDKYTWVDVGSSYLPSEILAAFLYAQIEQRAVIQARRLALWRRYERDLAEWATASDAALPHVPEHCEHPAHLFYVVLPSETRRRALMTHLQRQGIASVFHYVPLHTSSMGAHFGGREGDCPVAEQMSERLLRLPLSNGLTDHEQDRVIEAVIACR